MHSLNYYYWACLMGFDSLPFSPSHAYCLRAPVCYKYSAVDVLVGHTAVGSPGMSRLVPVFGSCWILALVSH